LKILCIFSFPHGFTLFSYVNCHSDKCEQIATVMVATGCIAAAAKIDPPKSPGGVNVYLPMCTRFLGPPSPYTNQFTCGSEFFQCPPVCLTHRRRGVVVSSVRRMNEVNARRARLVPGWVTGRAGIPSRYVTSQLGQLSLASLQGRLIEYQFRLGVRAGMSPLPGGR